MGQARSQSGLPDTEPHHPSYTQSPPAPMAASPVSVASSLPSQSTSPSSSIQSSLSPAVGGDIDSLDMDVHNAASLHSLPLRQLPVAYPPMAGVLKNTTRVPLKQRLILSSSSNVYHFEPALGDHIRGLLRRHDWAAPWQLITHTLFISVMETQWRRALESFLRGHGLDLTEAEVLQILTALIDDNFEESDTGWEFRNVFQSGRV
ncbi:hypothetical protein DL93DRAFT_2091119 [Clavulina sp. PMI_390]|nr:hypothetical protein DL93DRAFT_2091119 [Clavulina sp. PMI_390]